MVKSPTDERQDTKPDVRLNLTAFRHHLEAENRSPNTIRGYVDAVERMDSFLADRGMPRTVATIHREHVEAFIADQLDRFQPATAANRYRSVKQFFRWLTDEGEISESPMVRFKGPKVDRVPADILRETDIAALQKVTSGTAFDDRRDRAIIELFYATGIRRAELAASPRSSTEGASKRDSVGSTRIASATPPPTSCRPPGCRKAT